MSPGEYHIARRRRSGYYAFDLDGTLCIESTWRGHDYIGPPVAAMKTELLNHVERRQEVRVITARLSRLTNSEAELDIFVAAWTPWCMTHFGFVITAQSEKCRRMIALYDNRAIAVETNTGRLLSPRI